MTFVLQHPLFRTSERAYAVEVIFGDWLGLEVNLRPCERTDWLLADCAGLARLRMPDQFFERTALSWLKPESLQIEKLPHWRPRESFWDVPLLEDDLPIIAGREHPTGGYWQSFGTALDECWLGLDVLGSAFFLLSRYEEVAAPEVDQHHRFPAAASLAKREGFLERPLLDEYVEVLWAAMQRLWPGLRRRQMQGGVKFTCDVDIPYDPTIKSNSKLLRKIAADVIKRRSLSTVYSRVEAAAAARSGDFSKDPNNSFDAIMNLCEARGIKGSFFFISGHSAGEIDGCYSLDEPFISSLLTNIAHRGHEIGMHGSYNSFRNLEILRRERSCLVEACKKNRLDMPILGNRQHFLRWDSGITPKLLNDVGFEYDTTGGFADMPGFRFGTGRSFEMWDWRQGQKIKLRQKPLIMMETSVISNRYLGLGYGEETWEKVSRLKSRALYYGGNFTMLWHNSHLNLSDDWRLLDGLLK